MNEKTQVIQKNFSDSMDTWMNIMIDFQIQLEKENIMPSKYNDKTLMDLLWLFVHVLSNIGIHKKMINHENIGAISDELYAFIKKHTGVDTRTFYDKNQNFNLN